VLRRLLAVRFVGRKKLVINGRKQAAYFKVCFKKRLDTSGAFIFRLKECLQPCFDKIMFHAICSGYSHWGCRAWIACLEIKKPAVLHQWNLLNMWTARY